MGSFDAGGGILGNEAIFWVYMQFSGRKQEDFGIWLAMQQIAATYIDAEDIEQALTGLKTNWSHHLIGVFRRRCDGHRPTQSRDRLNKAERVGERRNAARMDQLFKPLLLSLGIDYGLPISIRDTQGL
jgi:hypothetical protein